jgi:5'-nucleotidase
MLQPYRMQLSAELDGVIGIASNIFPRGSNIERLGEVAIGNLTADSIRIKYGTQLAMVNGGGIRAPLPSTYAPANTMLRRTSAGYASGPPYDLVVGDAYAVFPFGNAVVTRTVTGTQLWAAMEYGIGSLPAANGKFPQISGFGFTYSLMAPVGARITEMHLMGGAPIPKDQTTFTLALPDFTNNGGDGYTMFADGQGVSRDLQADVLAEYIQTQMTITPTIEGRIVGLP